MPLISLKNTFDEDGLIFTKVENLFFHPQGGGQPNDKLLDKDANPVMIKKMGGDIYLGINPSSIQDGKIEIFVDQQFNRLCSRLHSAGHLIALVTEREFSTIPVKAHHFPNEAYIKFEGILDKELLSDMSKKLSAECDKNLAVKITHDEKGRLVTFEGLGGYHCGGTHVKCLSEIGDIELTSISNKKGATTIKYTLLDLDKA